MNEARKIRAREIGAPLRRPRGNMEAGHRKLKLMVYDLGVLAFVAVMILRVFPRGNVTLSWGEAGLQFLLAAVCVMVSRNVFKVYSQVWRYSRTNSYLRLLTADVVGGLTYVVAAHLIPVEHPTSFRMAGMVAIACMGSMVLRFLYTWLFETCTTSSSIRAFFSHRNLLTRAVNTLVYRVTGISLTNEALATVMPTKNKIRIAIIGAGRMGAMLAEELQNNPNAVYTPVCFIDVDKEKIGRQVCGIDVLPAGEGNKDRLDRLAVQEVVFAVKKSPEERAALYDRYKSMGFKVKVYTFPVENTEESGKRQIREFDVEELLFRREVDFLGDQTRRYYRDKVVLVSGSVHSRVPLRVSPGVPPMVMVKPFTVMVDPSISTSSPLMVTVAGSSWWGSDAAQYRAVTPSSSTTLSGSPSGAAMGQTGSVIYHQVKITWSAIHSSAQPPISS